MNIRVGGNQYDPDRLTCLGGGKFGEVYLLNERQALKVLYTPTETDRRHIMELCTATQSLDHTSLQAGVISVPLQEAYRLPDDDICGFTMDAFVHRVNGHAEPWPSLFEFSFDLNIGRFRNYNGFVFDDATAARTLVQIFQLLLTLESERLVFCDLSDSNVLFDPVSLRPGIIDTDSFKHQNNESSSLGTEGFVDPRLFSLGRSGLGGYHFDAKSDIYAATVLAYVMLMGVMPDSVPTDPVMKLEEMAMQRLSWARLLAHGTSAFEEAGYKVVPSRTADLLAERNQKLQSAARGIPDLGVILAQFKSIFVVGARENPVLSLNPDDDRSPRARRLQDMGHSTVIADLREKYALRVQQRIAPRQPQPDPSHLWAFIAKRGIQPLQLQDRT